MACLIENTKMAEMHKENGNQFYKQRKFAEALIEYDKAIELNKEEMSYFTNRAAVYLELGEYEKCLAECEQALKIKKNDYTKIAKTYARMGNCYSKMKEFEKSIEYYEKSLVEDNNRHTRAALKEVERMKEKAEKEAYINPELAENHRLNGNEHFKNKNYPAAKKEYDEGLKRNPNDAKLYSNRAACYMQLLEYPSALSDIQKALDIDPLFVKAWSRKGTVHFFLKEYHKAMKAYQEGLKIDPNNQECRDGLNRTMVKIQEVSSSDKVDEEQVAHALADPEIQQILSDPQFRLILEQMRENPAAIGEALRDPKIANGLQKLMAAGILRMGGAPGQE